MSELYHEYKHEYHGIIQDLNDLKAEKLSEEEIENFKKVSTIGEHKVSEKFN